MEQAIYLNDINKIDDLDARYGRLYYGVEFCENDMPSVRDAQTAYRKAADHGMSFTLVTPYVTDYGIRKTAELFNGLSDLGEMEVVINDYGTLMLLEEGYTAFEPVLGRLLVKQKRGFGLYKDALAYPENVIKHFMSSNIDYHAMREFLKKKGITRVEFDNMIQGIDPDLEGSGLSGSLYVPYGYVTTTRLCPWSYKSGKWDGVRQICERTCSIDVLTLESDIMRQTIYMRGNTQFFKNETVPSEEYLSRTGINRIVFEPDIPI